MTHIRPGLDFTGNAHYARKNFSGSVSTTPGTSPTQSAPDALTPGFVPGNLRAISSADPSLDGSLKWDAVPASTPLGTLLRYELLAYQRVVRSIPSTQTTYLPVAPENAAAPQFTVRAVYGMTMAGVTTETPSLASNVCMQAYQYPPNLLPNVPKTLPLPASLVTATAQWNSGAPLNLIEWYSDASAQYFRVDRDGVTLAEGLFTLEYLDASALPGSSHTYTVYRMDAQQTPAIYSPPSPPVTCVALTGPPAFNPALTLQNVTVYDYDGSAIIEFDAPYGFVDARAYKAATPDQVKYAGANPVQVGSSGQSLGPIQRRNRIAIQVDVPDGGADFKVEFVDKLGPAALMNIDTAQAMSMPVMATSTNGQGPPVNVPVALGPPALLHLTGIPDPNCISSMNVPNLVSGKFLSFHSPDLFVPIPVASLNAEMADARQFNIDMAADLAYFSTPDLTAVNFEMNTSDSLFFSMNRHMMDFGVEAGGPGSSDPAHIANGGNYFQVEPGADGLGTFFLQPGQVLQVFGLVDNVSGGRRWIDFFLKSVGDPFYNPGKFVETNSRNTKSGNLVRLQNRDDGHKCDVYYPPTTPFASDKTNSSFATNELVSALNNVALADWANDLGIEIEMLLQYQSGGGIRCQVRDRTRWTNDLTLQGGGSNIGGYDDVTEAPTNTFMWPWPATQRLQIATIHEVYHLAIDAREEAMNYTNYKRYEYNRRPYIDERHWHGFGYKILSQWPSD